MITRNLIFALITILFWGQQTTVNGQQTLCTVPESVEGTTSGRQILCTVPESVEGTMFSASTSSATSFPRTVDCCPLSVDYYESQIRKADSLYKNYLPQYNFDEVKVAMEFFDSLRLIKTTVNRQRTTDFVQWWTTDNSQQTTDIFHRSKTKSCTSDAYPRTVDCCPLSVDFICAKAHYYHAVGLTERDDIVGACEHYLIALEIMEEMMANNKSLKAKDKRLKANDKRLKAKGKKSVDNPEDYEKIRFTALICNRLGRLFNNENYCDLAILKYKKALGYVDLITDNSFKANLLKELGNSYQLSNNADTALYYYNESLRYNSNLTNILDVEKSIAQILFDKGEKDSAYILIKNNLNKIDNINLKYSYFNTLGEMYVEDEEYDSAIYYYKTSMSSNNINIKLSSAISLSSIYDSINDKQKKAVYDEILSKLFIKESKDIVNKTKLQSIYERYKERKVERERIKNRKKISSIIISLSCIVILMFTIIILIRRRYNKKHIELSLILNEKERNIIDKDDIINQITDEIKLKEEELQKLLFKNSFTDGKLKSKNAEIQNKDELIKKYELEIISLKNKLERTMSGLSNVNEYYNSIVCSKILKQIEELSEKNMDTSCLEPLKQEEFFLLLKCANRYLNNIFNDLSSKFPKLKKEDLYYLSLIIINLNDKQIASLFGVTYNSIKVRKRKICSIFNITTEELYKFLNNHL